MEALIILLALAFITSTTLLVIAHVRARRERASYGPRAVPQYASSDR